MIGAQTFSISSVRPPGRLSLEWTEPAYFDATLEDDGLHAVTNIHGMVTGPEDLPAGFFDDLAKNWRGWLGRNGWQSDARDLPLQVTPDGQGPVVLLVTLGAGTDSSLWRSQTTLVLEAGQLDGYATAFHSFIL